MTKRERVFGLIEGKEIDRTPVGFWLHFPEEFQHGEASVNAHIDFMKQTDTDILKVMNENILYDGETKIMSSKDIGKFRGYSKSDKVMQDQMEIIKRISDQTKGEYPILATIHGLLASAFHETGFSGFFTSMGYSLALFCREKPEEMKKAFGRIAETLMEFVDCSLEAGAEGIFYAALGGESRYFTSEEYNEFVLPYELMIYEHIKSKTKFDVLHICKSGIGFDRYVLLKPTIVNWGVYTNGFTLTEGAELFKDSIILGGFPDRQGVLVDGSKDEIYNHSKMVLEEMKGKRFIVGSDCTLPTKISYDRIRSVVDSVKELKR